MNPRCPRCHSAANVQPVGVHVWLCQPCTSKTGFYHFAVMPNTQRWEAWKTQQNEQEVQCQNL